jgi:hypothetical protein
MKYRWFMLGETEKNHENPYLVYPVTQLRFEWVITKNTNVEEIKITFVSFCILESITSLVSLFCAHVS